MDFCDEPLAAALREDADETDEAPPFEAAGRSLLVHATGDIAGLAHPDLLPIDYDGISWYPPRAGTLVVIGTVELPDRMIAADLRDFVALLGLGVPSLGSHAASAAPWAKQAIAERKEEPLSEVEKSFRSWRKQQAIKLPSARRRDNRQASQASPPHVSRVAPLSGAWAFCCLRAVRLSGIRALLSARSNTANTGR